ncbi:MAG: ATP-binding protein [Sedimentisphaerales bacterium]|nr:ATP-binding protein [Sedimentisphaerales bacterium]
MSKMQHVYMIESLVDPSSPKAKAIAGGCSINAIFDNNVQFLRILSEFPAGSVTMTLRFMYEPTNNLKQNRLKIFLIAQSNAKEQDNCLLLLLEKGPLIQFYSLQKVEKIGPVPWNQFNACCDIIRKQTVYEPTVTAEFNSMAMPYYYAIEPFNAENSNDYMKLDNLLDRLTGPAVIDICVEPVDTNTVSMNLSKCISRYQTINRIWDHDDGDLYHYDRGKDGQDWSTALKPLKQKEFLIDEILRKLRKLHDTLTQKNLKFSIRIFAEDKPAARLLGSIVAESGLCEGVYEMHNSCRGECIFDDLVQNADNIKLMTPSMFEIPETIKDIELYKNLLVLCNMSTIDEIAGVFRLPVPSALRSPRCIRKDTDPENVPLDEMIIIGTNENRIKIGISLKNLLKHCSIFGLPGGGKSILSTSIISQFCMKNIPFILFEPGKSEYRRLKCLKKSKNQAARKLARKLKIFTLGSDISPISINPLQIPEGITVYEHIENLLCCFKAAMPLEGPMIGILAEALELVYQEYKKTGIIPVISDVHLAVKRVLAPKTYSCEVKSNLYAASDVRLGQLSKRSIGQVFKNRYSCPTLKELLISFSVIELAVLPPEQASLLTLFILTMICECVKSTPYSGEGVRLAIILEEAHNLVGPDTSAAVSDTNANPKAFAAELICRMLAELRSLGIAIIILDQLPSGVAPQVVKNTASKVVFRQVDNTDRNIIGGAMLFNDVDMAQIARLRPGQAYFHTEGYYSPQIVVTPHLKKEWNIPEPPVGVQILPYLKDDDWFVEAVSNRIMIQAQNFKEGLDKYADYRKSVVNQVKELQSEFLRLQLDHPGTLERFSQIAGNAQELRKKLHRSLAAFESLYYEPYILSEKHSSLADRPAGDYLNNQILRYEKTYQFNQKYVTILDNLITLINRTMDK